MKKIFLLFILTFLLSGCYDYNELNDLAIISGIGIDYTNDKYEVTFEIMSTKKEGDSSSASTSSYTVSSKGKTVFEAFSNNGNIMDKVPYYDHVEVVVIDEEVAKNHLEEVAEFLIRNSKFRNEVYLTISSNTKAKDLLSASFKEKPDASSFIVGLLEHSSNSSSAGYYDIFTETLNNILTKGKDARLPVFTLKDKKISLIGIGLFKDFKLQTILDNKSSVILNILSNFNVETALFEKSCASNNKTVISIYESNISIEPNNKNTIISGNISARINEDTCNYDLKKTNTYELLEDQFTKVITEDFNNTINNLKLYQTDILSIGKSYYNKYRKPYYNLWINQDFIYDIDLKINKKGLIFEVN